MVRNRPETWPHNSRHMLRNFSTKTINSENRNENLHLHNKITFQEKNSRKCSIILMKKSKSMKKNSKSTEWRFNSTNKKHKWTDNNCKKLAKSPWRKKVESGNWNTIKTLIQKVVIPTITSHRMRIMIFKEGMSTFSNKMWGSGEKSKPIWFINFNSKIWKEDLWKKRIITWKNNSISRKLNFKD